MASRSLPRSVFRETPQYPATTPQGTPQRTLQIFLSAPKYPRNVPRTLPRTAHFFWDPMASVERKNHPNVAPHAGQMFKKSSNMYRPWVAKHNIKHMAA